MRPPSSRSWILVTVLLSAAACREGVREPTAPEATPALATATQALSFAQLNIGQFHSCGVTTSHQVYCWGYNGSSQFGDGSSNNSSRPVAAIGGKQFRQVSSGSTHTCGVTTDLHAYCWGDNGLGQLGDGTTNPHKQPALVAGGHRFSQITASDFHSCGVSYPDGRGFCWGGNDEGQLGDGTSVQHLTPTAVAGGHTFKQLSGGFLFTCGVTTSNQAFCWGSDSYANWATTRPSLGVASPLSSRGAIPSSSSARAPITLAP